MANVKKSATKRQARPVKQKEKKPLNPKVQRQLREVAALLLFALALLIFLSLLGFDSNDQGLLFSTSNADQPTQNFTGVFGAAIADGLMLGFGYVAYAIPFIIIYASYMLAWGKLKEDDKLDYTLFFIRGGGLLLFLLSSAGLVAMHFGVTPESLPKGTNPSAGGAVGLLLGNHGFYRLMGEVGATLALFTLFLVSISLATHISWLAVIEFIGKHAIRFWVWLTDFVAQKKRLWLAKKEESQVKEARKEMFEVGIQQKEARKATQSKPKIEPMIETPKKVSEREQKEQQIPLFTPSLSSNSDAQLPELGLLDAPKAQVFGYSPDALEAMSQLLENKLKDFNVDAQVVHIQPGPVITRFEIQPAPGTKASKITGLARDLARSMSVVSVRVVEVIPGKSTIGIEIPNEKREIINFQEIMKSDAFEKKKSALTIGLGKDIGGRPMAADLAKMPHLLVAGTTGSGKSVAINAMLLSLLYKATANEVRMILIDPKMLELNVYEGIPHLLCPVVTDMKDATNALRWSVGEMERRYKLMSQLGVRNLAGFNKKIREAIEAGEPIKDPLYKPEEAFDPEAEHPTLEPIPFIVVVIDEFADMMMVVGKKAEELIARLAQKARAAGIHLVLATQRPSVDVVTGLIKANVPTRIAFQVSSRIDSRTILDQMGAEQLLGHGDMLYYQPGITSVPERVHGAFVDDHEVHNVVGFLKSLGEPDYLDEVLQEGQAPIAGITGEQASDASDGLDELYDQAVKIVTESRKASISYVQRRLRVGYNRAASMLEMMEEQGVVSSMESGGSRQVIAPPPPPAE